MLKFEQKVLEFEFMETVHKLRFPTIRDAQRLKEQLDLVEKGEGNNLDANLIFLEGLGLKREVSELLTIDQLEQITNALNDKKKH